MAFFVAGLMVANAQTIVSESSQVKFEVSNMGFGSVDGSFGGMNGQVRFSPDNLENASFNVCVDAASVDTENNGRDKHLKKEDFFYVEKFPEICFSSTTVEKSGDGYEVAGELTMLGVTKQVTIPFAYDENTLNGKFTIQRKDFDLGPSGGFMVGKTVDVNIICVLEENK